MKKISITLQNSGNFSDIRIDQDNRKCDLEKEKYILNHVDTEKSKDNIYWSGNSSIEDFYNKIFQESYEEFLASEKEKNSENENDYKPTYYEQILSEQLANEEDKKALIMSGVSSAEANMQIKAKRKVAYQTIVQLGGRTGPFGLENLTEEKKVQIKKIMGEYMTRWERKYPHMKLINVAVHLDEVGNDGKTGTVHMHITYCPVADGYEKGQKIQNSLTRALKQMGYESTKSEDGKYSYAIAKWQNDMRTLLESIIAKYGYERKGKADAFTKALRGSKIYLEEQGYVTETAENDENLENKIKTANEKVSVSEDEVLKNINVTDEIKCEDKSDKHEQLGETDIQANKSSSIITEQPIIAESLITTDDFDIPEISEIVEMPEMSESLEAADREATLKNNANESESCKTKNVVSNDVDEAVTSDDSKDKSNFYNGLKSAIEDGLSSLCKVDNYLKMKGIAPETVGCDYVLELECLQEHFNGIIALLEYYQKEHKEICSDIIDAFIYNLKKESMCIGINEDEKLYTVTEDVLMRTKEETI